MKSNMTYHAKEERKNRFDYIMDTVGFGKQVISCEDEGNVIKCLTDTGVIVVKAKGTHKIITSYIARLAEAGRIYEIVTGNARLPRSMFTTVRNNYPLLANQPSC